MWSGRGGIVEELCAGIAGWRGGILGRVVREMRSGSGNVVRETMKCGGAVGDWDRECGLFVF